MIVLSRTRVVAATAARIGFRKAHSASSCCFASARRPTSTTMMLRLIAPSASTMLTMSTVSTMTSTSAAARLVFPSTSTTRSSTVAARASAASSSWSSSSSSSSSSHSSLPFSTSPTTSTSSSFSLTSPPLSPEDTAEAARLARVAGLAYAPRSELPELLRETGHELVEDLGETFFTRVFVADDVRGGAAGGESDKSYGRVIAMRGLAWAGTEKADLVRLAAALAKVWPVEIASATSASSASADDTAAAAATTTTTTLHAHAGVAELASEAARLVRRHVRSTPPMTPITFAGHSLGGALALATAVLLASEGEVGCRPKRKKEKTMATNSSSPLIESCRRPVRVVTFGAPPSLAPASGDGDLNASLADLFGPGFPLSPSTSSASSASSSASSSSSSSSSAAAVTSFFAEGDPVPRWLLSSDPTFSAAASAFPPLALALQARSWLLGDSAPLSTRRFLYLPAGDCFLISWHPEKGHCVLPLPRDGSAVSDALGEAALDERTPAAVAAAAAKDVVDRVSSSTAAAAGAAASAAVGRGRGVAVVNNSSSSTSSSSAPSGSNIRRAIGFLLDHAHTSYADDLNAAATQARRRRENKKEGEIKKSKTKSKK